MMMSVAAAAQILAAIATHSLKKTRLQAQHSIPKAKKAS